MNWLAHILTVLLFPPLAGMPAKDGLAVDSPVPGLAASEHYQARVRFSNAGSEWQSAFAWGAVCKTIDKKRDGKACVRHDQPCLVAGDIDAQMDAQDTGKSHNWADLEQISPT